MADVLAFPDHGIDPKKKDEKWILQFAKAAWGSWAAGMPVGSIFAAKAARYQEIKDYAMGRQAVTKYKKQLLPEDSQDESYEKIDYTPPTNGMVLRNIAVAKLQKAGYNILCTAINPTAKDAQDEEYAKAKIKIMMRDAMKQQAPELADHPMFKKLPGEAGDLEELQMEIDHNPKFIRAKDIEQSIQLVFYENEMQKALDSAAEDIVDNGVAIIKEYLDENNKVVIRNTALDQFACSYTRKKDFSDITWAFELIPTKLSDLAKYFNDDQLEIIKSKCAGMNGNPSSMGLNTVEFNGWDIFKTNVVDLVFLSWNKRVIEERKDANGNLKVGKTKPSKEGKSNGDVNYTAKSIEVIYKCKWIPGTDFIYDFGLMPNVPRSVNIATMSKTRLPYHIQAASFNNMRAKGLTENMIPFIDDLCIATYQYRKFVSGLIPSGLDIDIAALEAVALGSAGNKLTTDDLLELLYSKGVVLSRRSGTSMDSNVNYKAVNPFSVNNLENLTALYNAIQTAKQGLRDVTGLNELTDGSTPNARMLTTTANLANESTNNALWYLISARRDLLESVAKGTVRNLQVALKRGPYDGFNKDAGRWITVPKSILDYDYDLMIEDKPTDEQKAALMELVKEDLANGYLDTADVITIINANNIKQAQIILAYKAKINKQKMQDNTLQNTQNTTLLQAKANAAAETVKDQVAENQLHRDLIILNAEKAWDYEIAALKVGQADRAVATKAAADVLKTGGQLPQGQPPAQPEAETPAETVAEGGVEEPAMAQ